MLADESLLADILLKKYDDHLTLNRIIEIYYRDAQVSLAKQTLSAWVLHATHWLAPVADAVLAALLKQETVLHVDETVLPLLRPMRTVSARAWAYVGASMDASSPCASSGGRRRAGARAQARCE